LANRVNGANINDLAKIENNLESGVVWVNSLPLPSNFAPFGGYKQR